MRGFVRIGAAVPPCGVAAVERNAEETLALWRTAHEEGCAVVVFPELGLTAYTARDLFFDAHLHAEVERALAHLVEASRDLAPLALLGLPLRVGPSLYNVAVAVLGGRVLAVVPKSYLPTYREFEEARWFQPGTQVPPGSTARVLGEAVPFGTDVLLEATGVPDLVVGVEVCEDMWVQAPPSAAQVSAGATVCCNLSASNFTIGKAELRRLLARSLSDRGKCVYVYVAAGPGESSTDLAFDADAFVCEDGRELASSRRFARDGQLVSVDVDLELLVHERLQTTSFGACAAQAARPFRRVPFTAAAPAGALRRQVSPHPFIPSDPATLATRCWEVFEIQTNALATRMRATGISRLVLGVSGGLDSTHAALVAAGALDLLGLPRTNLLGVTMPGLGTTSGTRGNAERLARALDAEFREVGVSEATHLVLSASEHAAARGTRGVDDLLARLREQPALGDIALENVQARLRTLLLFTLANQACALVVGTGDLSEKALGWSTYTGDHISSYDVNAGVPKTLIQFVIRWVANERAATWSRGDPQALREVLFAILHTPISPELLPPDPTGEIAQLTEGTIGPYELHDFFLYHLVRHKRRPTKLLDLARAAFAGRHDDEALRRWLGVFLRRFFHNQFKRSCTPDGPKVGMVALSPRGDWRMPSDAQVASWLAEVEAWRP
ncbi:MAG: NAD(+) synthase [Planctomycetes bacterium]|nr:NAD(+) synthase [Planctomycetota bacterium]